MSDTVNPRAVRVLAHSARMAAQLALDPAHVRKSEYTAQFARYRAEWDQFDVATREGATAAAGEIDNLNPDMIAAGRAALEE